MIKSKGCLLMNRSRKKRLMIKSYREGFWTTLNVRSDTLQTILSKVIPPTTQRTRKTITKPRRRLLMTSYTTKLSKILSLKNSITNRITCRTNHICLTRFWKLKMKLLRCKKTVNSTTTYPKVVTWVVSEGQSRAKRSKTLSFSGLTEIN